jgi:hypothetical protein
MLSLPSAPLMFHRTALFPAFVLLRSVMFSFLGRDFFNALAAKDQEKFQEMLIKWMGGICLGVPVYVLRWATGAHGAAALPSLPLAAARRRL